MDDAPPEAGDASGNRSWPYRVLVAKIGLDGHDRGARVVARALRDAGMEVIYTGRHATVPGIANTAVSEDVDVVGLSILSGAHAPLTRSLLEEFDRLGVRGDIAVVVGGTIPTAAARDELLAMGVADVFPGSTFLPDVVRRVQEVARARRAHVAGAR